MQHSMWVTDPWRKEVNRLQARHAKLQNPRGPFKHKHNQDNLKVLRETQEHLQGIKSRLKEWQDQRMKYMKKQVA